MNRVDSLLNDIRHCQLCAKYLPLGPRPILQMQPEAKILIAAQAPGRKAHASGTPFDDASGERLREWMGIDKNIFYDPQQVAILPMGFCYPGRGKSGDLPPRPECAPAWRQQLLHELPHLQLTLAIGQYAQKYHLPNKQKTLTETVMAWRNYGPNTIPLPHPSPRNNIWLSRNPWFEEELLPQLRAQVSKILAHG
jgi:uracil-DNA glycosylase